MEARGLLGRAGHEEGPVVVVLFDDVPIGEDDHARIEGGLDGCHHVSVAHEILDEGRVEEDLDAASRLEHEDGIARARRSDRQDGGAAWSSPFFVR